MPDLIEPNDQLELLTLSSDEFAQGLAKLVAYVMDNRDKPIKHIMGGGTPSTGGEAVIVDTVRDFTQE